MYKPTDDSYFESKEFQQLLARYERAAETGQAVLQDADELTDIADFYHYTHQDDKAEKAIEKAIGLFPGATSPLVYKINEALDANDTATAKSLLDRITDHYDLEYLYTKGTIMLAEKHTDEAVDFFEKQWKLIDEDDRADFAFDVTSIFCDYSMAEQATQWYARTEADEEEEYKELTARLRFCQKDYAQSEKLYGELTESKPLGLRYWVGLGQSLYMQDKLEDALNAFDFALAIDDNQMDSIGGKAFCLYQMYKSKEAEPYFRIYCESHPDDYVAWRQWAFSLLKNDDYDKAEEILDDLVHKPKIDMALLIDVIGDWVYALTMNYHYDKAIDAIDMSIRLGADKVDAEVSRGMVYVHWKAHDKARESFERAVELADDKYGAIMKIAIAYFEYGFVEKASGYFKAVEQMAGEDYPRLACYQTICCYELKDESELFVYLDRAIAADPDLLKQMFSELIPFDVAVEDYPEYFKKNFNKQE